MQGWVGNVSRKIQARERFLEIKEQKNHDKKGGPKFIKKTFTILNKTITITAAKDEFGKVIACQTWVLKYVFSGFLLFSASEVCPLSLVEFKRDLVSPGKNQSPSVVRKQSN